jgi:predicted RNA binding protein YcfA (HicA-like mRNA interferase family)
MDQQRCGVTDTGCRTSWRKPRLRGSHESLAHRLPSAVHAYEVEELTAPGRGDAWAFVSHFSADRYLSSYYLHWSGHGWKRVTVPIRPGSFLTT